MYRKNQIYRNVLITPDEVIFHASTRHTMDVRMVENSIIVAEERLIMPTLGHEFYNSLIEEKNVTVTSANKSALQAAVNNSLPAGSQIVTLQEGDVVNSMSHLSTDNQALWKQHLWKLTAECVMLSAFPEGYAQFTSEGVQHMNPVNPMSGGAATPELRSMKWSMDKKMMDRIDPLREAMHLWLCTKRKSDKTKYPLYTKPCDCNVDGVAYKRKSDIVLGIYDDENDSNCCN